MDANRTWPGYELESELARVSVHATDRDPNRRLAWINSICILFLLIGITGSKPAPIEIRALPRVEEVTAAMDSLRAELQAASRGLEQAKVDVRAVVGDVIGMDSAEEVYRFALGKMGHDHKDMPAAGLRTMFNAMKDVKASRPEPRIAEDSATTVKQFNLDRFGQA